MEFVWWLAGVTFIIVLVVMYLISLSQRMLEREKHDPVFAEKADRFRDKASKIMPSERVKLIIGQLIAIAFLIYAYFYSGTGE